MLYDEKDDQERCCILDDFVGVVSIKNKHLRGLCGQRDEVDMPLRRFRRQYEQLSQFERGKIIGMMEAGWSAKRVAPQLGLSDCVVTSGFKRCHLYED
ncbi:hypothetical protein TNCV_5039181 [Trichonephila clavipes]|nr:hypothetical protein TNCV_5039181 [Trichonephila clavipes]